MCTVKCVRDYLRELLHIRKTFDGYIHFGVSGMTPPSLVTRHCSCTFAVTTVPGFSLATAPARAIRGLVCSLDSRRGARKDCLADADSSAMMAWRADSAIGPAGRRLPDRRTEWEGS